MEYVEGKSAQYVGQMNAFMSEEIGAACAHLREKGLWTQGEVGSFAYVALLPLLRLRLTRGLRRLARSYPYGARAEFFDKKLAPHFRFLRATSLMDLDESLYCPRVDFAYSQSNASDSHLQYGSSAYTVCWKRPSCGD